jgi:hypothetical protein
MFFGFHLASAVVVVVVHGRNTLQADSGDSYAKSVTLFVTPITHLFRCGLALYVRAAVVEASIWVCLQHPSSYLS